MTYDLNKFAKYAWLAAPVGFYQVYAAKNPADPFGQMWTDLQYYMNNITTGGAWTKIQTKFMNIATVIALIVLLPIVMKMFKLPVWAKGITNAVAYYYIGDQVARILDDPITTSYSGATRSYGSTWSNSPSAKNAATFGQASGQSYANIYGG